MLAVASGEDEISGISLDQIIYVSSNFSEQHSLTYRLGLLLPFYVALEMTKHTPKSFLVAFADSLE